LASCAIISGEFNEPGLCHIRHRPDTEQDPVHPFTLAFLAALAASMALRLWLDARHIRHVRRHREAVPDAFAVTVTPEAHRKAADYTVAKTRLAVVHALVDGALLLGLTLGGGVDLLDRVARGLSGQPLLQGLALIGGVVLVAAAVDLPLTAWRIFRIEARFGFNRMTPAMFLGDLGKQFLVTLALGAPLAAAVLWLMQQAGTYWWLYAWAVWVAFNLLVVAIYPTYIAPLFNKFTPLADAALKERVEALLVRCGFRAQGLYVMDGSRRSSHGNAYFTGFGRGKRIVFFDTLLTRLTPPEVEAVLAHELGHFRRRHVVKRIAWTFATSLGFLWLLGVLKEAPWFYAALGVSEPSTAAALVLFFLAVPVFTFPLQPLLAWYSRRHEYEADAYAAEHASAGSLVDALVKLYKDNAATLTPDPLHSAVYDSHPPAALRIARLRQAARPS
jgi:STE24 endopeptidase